MNYIGSKKTLLPFIYETINKSVEKIEEKVFCDLFAGTGIVGQFFKNKTKKVLSNDFEYYSFVLIRNYIQNNKIFKIPFEIKKSEGLIYNNYCLGSGSNRLYFSDNNGLYIDGIRKQIEAYKKDEDLYFFLLCSLIESADKVANTASVYGAFLKNLKKSALKDIDFKEYQPAEGNKGECFNKDANCLIKEIKGDILYLDPPYNSRQYGSNYHILNTIALYKNFRPAGITGLPEYKRSKYSIKAQAKECFDDLIKRADFPHIFISYNNEGIIETSMLKNILEKYGECKSFVFEEYKRFKADNSRNYKYKNTKEYLYYLKKR